MTWLGDEKTNGQEWTQNPNRDRSEKRSALLLFPSLLNLFNTARDVREFRSGGECEGDLHGKVI